MRSDAEQLDLKHQSGARVDDRGRATLAVGEDCRTNKTTLATDLHELQRLRPARYDRAQIERGRLAALDRAVEHRAIDELALVIHGDLIGALWARTRACSQREIDDSSRRLLRAGRG